MRQCLLEFFHACVRDRGVAEVQLSELCQTFEVVKPGVRDVCVVEVQLHELCQSFQVFQPSVCDIGVVRSAVGVVSVL